MNPKKILIAGQMGIGNMIMFLPLIKSLRRTFYNSHIAVVFFYSNGSDEVLKYLSPNIVDEIIYINKKNIFSRIFTIVSIGIRFWDMVVFRFNGYSIDLIISTLISNAKYRVGHVSSKNWKNKYDFIINFPVKMDSDKHEIKRYQDIIINLNLQSVEKFPSLNLKDKSSTKVKNDLLKKTGLKDKSFVILSPGSSKNQSWKRWSLKSWNKLVQEIGKLNLVPVFTGSNDEIELVKSITNSLDKTSFIDTSGKLTLYEITVLINCSNLVVCCDSALIHISHAIKKYCIGLYGPTDEKRTGYNDSFSYPLRSEICKGACYNLCDTNWLMNCDTEKCMNDIKVDQVIKVIKLINKNYEKQ